MSRRFEISGFGLGVAYTNNNRRHEVIRFALGVIQSSCFVVLWGRS